MEKRAAVRALRGTTASSRTTPPHRVAAVPVHPIGTRTRPPRTTSVLSTSATARIGSGAGSGGAGGGGAAAWVATGVTGGGGGGGGGRDTGGETERFGSVLTSGPSSQRSWAIVPAPSCASCSHTIHPYSGVPPSSVRT